MLDPRFPERLLEYPIDENLAVHMGGGLWMTAGGDLYIGTGDTPVPIPELPVDQRPGQEFRDALRTSANTQDLRGKVLRIHPEPAGGYSIPRGTSSRAARAAGPRSSPWGSATLPALRRRAGRSPLLGRRRAEHLRVDRVGPNGYDEVNRAATPGNFGWPMFVGPNTPYRSYDFQDRPGRRAVRPPAAAEHLAQQHGRGAAAPPAGGADLVPDDRVSRIPGPGLRGAFGDGQRGVLRQPLLRPVLKMPEALDGRLIIHDWTRNWIKTVALDASGGVASIDPFMPGTLFRKPMQVAVRGDGTLYVLEYGDKWGDNRGRPDFPDRVPPRKPPSRGAADREH